MRPTNRLRITAKSDRAPTSRQRARLPRPRRARRRRRGRSRVNGTPNVARTRRRRTGPEAVTTSSYSSPLASAVSTLHVGKTRHASGVELDRARRSPRQMPQVGDQSVGNIDGRGRAPAGQPTRLGEARATDCANRSRSGTGSFAATTALERGAPAPRAARHIDHVVRPSAAPRERRERAAEDGGRDRELGAVAQVAADHVGVRNAATASPKPSAERSSSARQRVRERRARASTPSGRAAIAAKSLSAATTARRADLSRSEPAAPEMHALDDASTLTTSESPRGTPKHRRVVADTFARGPRRASIARMASNSAPGPRGGCGHGAGASPPRSSVTGRESSARTG